MVYYNLSYHTGQYLRIIIHMYWIFAMRFSLSPHDLKKQRVVSFLFYRNRNKV